MPKESNAPNKISDEALADKIISVKRMIVMDAEYISSMPQFRKLLACLSDPHTQRRN